MDPNETLIRMRGELAEGKRRMAAGFPGNQVLPCFAMAAELAADLDEWLSKGGFLPVEWKAKEGK